MTGCSSRVLSQAGSSLSLSSLDTGDGLRKRTRGVPPSPPQPSPAGGEAWLSSPARGKGGRERAQDGERNPWLVRASSAYPNLSGPLDFRDPAELRDRIQRSRARGDLAAPSAHLHFRAGLPSCLCHRSFSLPLRRTGRNCSAASAFHSPRYHPRSTKPACQGSVPAYCATD